MSKPTGSVAENLVCEGCRAPKSHPQCLDCPSAPDPAYGIPKSILYMLHSLVSIRVGRYVHAVSAELNLGLRELRASLGPVSPRGMVGNVSGFFEWRLELRSQDRGCRSGAVSVGRSPSLHGGCGIFVFAWLSITSTCSPSGQVTRLQVRSCQIQDF